VRSSILVAGSVVALVGCGQLEAVLKPAARAPAPVARAGSAPQPTSALRPELSAEEEQKFLDEARDLGCKVGQTGSRLAVHIGRSYSLPAWKNRSDLVSGD